MTLLWSREGTLAGPSRLNRRPRHLRMTPQQSSRRPPSAESITTGQCCSAKRTIPTGRGDGVKPMANAFRAMKVRSTTNPNRIDECPKTIAGQPKSYPLSKKFSDTEHRIQCLARRVFCSVTSPFTTCRPANFGTTCISGHSVACRTPLASGQGLKGFGANQVASLSAGRPASFLWRPYPFPVLFHQDPRYSAC